MLSLELCWWWFNTGKRNHTCFCSVLSHCVLWDTKILLQDTDILLHVWEIFCEISEWWASLANHQPVHTRWPLLPKSSFFSSLTYPDMSLWVEYKREKKTNSSWSSSAARRYSRGRWGCGGQLNYLFKFSKFSTMMIVTKRTAKRELCGLKAGYISGQSGLIITTQPARWSWTTPPQHCHRGKCMHEGFLIDFKWSKSNLANPRKNLTTVDTHLTHGMVLTAPTASKLESNMYLTPPLAPLWPKMKVQSPDLISLPCVTGKSKTLCELERFVWLLHQIHCNAVGRGAKAQLLVTKWPKTAICSKLLQTLPLQPKLGEREFASQVHKLTSKVWSSIWKILREAEQNSMYVKQGNQGDTKAGVGVSTIFSSEYLPEQDVIRNQMFVFLRFSLRFLFKFFVFLSEGRWWRREPCGSFPDEGKPCLAIARLSSTDLFCLSPHTQELSWS